MRPRDELRRIFSSVEPSHDISIKLANYETKIYRENLPIEVRLRNEKLGTSFESELVFRNNLYKKERRVFAFSSLSPEQREKALENGLDYLLRREKLSVDQVMKEAVRFLSIELGPPSSETIRSWKGHLPYPPKPKGLSPEHPEYEDYQQAKQDLRRGELDRVAAEYLTVFVRSAEIMQYYRNNYCPKRKPQAPKPQEPKPKTSFKKK